MLCLVSIYEIFVCPFSFLICGVSQSTVPHHMAGIEITNNHNRNRVIGERGRGGERGQDGGTRGRGRKRTS